MEVHRYRHLLSWGPAEDSHGNVGIAEELWSMQCSENWLKPRWTVWSFNNSLLLILSKAVGKWEHFKSTQSMDYNVCMLEKVSEIRLKHSLKVVLCN